MKPEELIEAAIIKARDKGITITRGAVFDWVEGTYPNSHKTTVPVSCNALGAVLIFLKKESLVSNGFNKNWLDPICEYIGENKFWIWKFVSGFNYGNLLYLTFFEDDKDKKKKKEINIKDDVSRIADRLAKKYTIKSIK
ncbi:MAG TPA: hypothetical protein VMV86_04330 [Methanosarcinales archaeon]|nr:hypothetical protein [Methanosarcinales archaeon]